MRRILIAILLLTYQNSISQTKKALDSHLQPAVFAVTMVMIHDVVNPPAASRFYTYCLLGAQEIVSQNNRAIASPTAYIKSFEPITFDPSPGYNYQIAALYSIMETGRVILPSGYLLEEDQKKLIIALLREGYSQETIDKSIAAAQIVAKKIAAYAAGDNYLKLSTRLRYRPKKGDAYWYPTPPGYIE